jgi:hypothetical protein
MPQAIKDLRAQVDSLQDQVVRLQEVREELLGERNFAAQVANDIHSSRMRLVTKGNSLLATADPAGHRRPGHEEVQGVMGYHSLPVGKSSGVSIR